MRDYTACDIIIRSAGEKWSGQSRTSRTGGAAPALKAFDMDPSGQNSHLQISISSGNEDCMFALDPSTRALTVARMLNYELQTSFILTANVCNHLADPELYSTCQINISVADQNDNDPEFSRAFYRVLIPKALQQGRILLSWWPQTLILVPTLSWCFQSHTWKFSFHSPSIRALVQ